MEVDESIDELGGYKCSLAEDIQKEKKIFDIIKDKLSDLQERDETIDDFCLSFAPELSVPGLRFFCRGI